MQARPKRDHSKNQKGPPRLSRDGKGPAPGRVLEMAESSPDKFTYENKIAERFGGQKRVGASRVDPIGNSIVRNERGRQPRRPLYSARKGADPFTFRSRAQHLRPRSARDASTRFFSFTISNTSGPHGGADMRRARGADNKLWASRHNVWVAFVECTSRLMSDIN
jgi:hypothetical protein